RGVWGDAPLPDGELLRDVAAPTIVVTIEGDEIHPAELGRLLSELLPNAELIALGGQEELLRRIPELVARVSAFIAGEDGAGQRGGEKAAGRPKRELLATQVPSEMQADTRAAVGPDGGSVVLPEAVVEHRSVCRTATRAVVAGSPPPAR